MGIGWSVVRKVMVYPSKRPRQGLDEGFAAIPRSDAAEALDLGAAVSSAAATAGLPVVSPEDSAAGTGSPADGEDTA